MTTDPRKWDPFVSTDAVPPSSEYGIVSQLVTRCGGHGGKEPYPDDLSED